MERSPRSRLIQPRRPGDGLGSEDSGYVLVEVNQAIAPAFRALPEREQTILRLRFHHDLKQSEIAKVVGVSQMHVSRLLKRSIESLSAAATSSSYPDPLVHDSTSLL